MFGIGVQELIIVLVIALLVFGGKNLPRIGSDMGRAIRNFRSAVNAPEVIDVEPTRETKDDRDAKA
jgi:sec-independent protein translocase protein TatA